MKSQKLTVKEITELQPTAVEYAAERETVLGGIEVSGDIDRGEVESLVKSLFVATAKLDEAEPCDGDGCVHFVVVDGSDRTYYGFRSANVWEEPAWFHTKEAAERFAQACGWESVEVETCNNPSVRDILDTPDKPWTEK